MSRITFRVNSIELKDSALHSINPNSIIRLNVTQKPTTNSEEYLLKNVSCLADINHQFAIDDPYNNCEFLSMTVRSVLKKTTFASIFGLDDDIPQKKPNDKTVDKFVNGFRENRKNNVDCEYKETKHSLIGFCQINLKNIEKGINNSLQYKLITKKNEVVGFVNFDIYIWDSPSKTNYQRKITESTGPILFVDPGCQTPTNQTF